MKVTPPELIKSDHDLKEFDCGNATLNDWLKNKALKNQDKYSKTRVVCEGSNVIAYYTLLYGSVNREEMKGKYKNNAPERIPVMILGRLAVDVNWQGKGIAKHLLKEAMLKTLEAAEIAGVRGLLVHAIDDNAKSFYQHYGFIENSIELTLLLPIEDLKAQI